MRTSFQSASSSSATIWASAVPTPWPISAFVMCTVMIPSGVIVRVAFGSNAAAADASRAPPPGMVKLRVRPAPATAVVFRKSRRLSSVLVLFGLDPPRGALDRALDAQIRGAAADVAGHRGHDLLVGRVGALRQERRRLHDLARL